MIRLGGPVFTGDGEGPGGADDPIALARLHKEKGYSAAYVPYALDVNDTVKIREVRAAFEAEGVMFAEVGFWDNLVDTDEETRAINRRMMVESLALAEEIGARCAVNIFGSYCHGNGNSQHAAKNFSEKAFDEAVEMARYFIDTVQPKTACFAYELFPFSVVDSPAQVARLIEAVDRDQFGVHLDLVNLITSPRAYWNSGTIMRECIGLFGNRIVASHVKDIKMQEPAISVILEEVVAGAGALDMAAFVHEIGRLPQEVPFMMEHLADEAEYDQAAAHIRAVAASEGIPI